MWLKNRSLSTSGALVALYSRTFSSVRPSLVVAAGAVPSGCPGRKSTNDTAASGKESSISRFSP